MSLHARPTYSQRLSDLFAKMDGEPEFAFTSVPFGSMLAIAVAQIALVVGLAGLGLFLMEWFEQKRSATGCLLGLALALFGAILAGTVPLLFNRTFLVCPGGLVRRDWKSTEVCRWEDLSHIRAEDQGRYCLVRKDGRSWQVDSTDFKQGDAMDGVLRAGAERHAVEWYRGEAKGG